MSFRNVLGSLLIPRQTLGSLLLDGVPPGSEIQVMLANSVAYAHVWAVYPLDADRSACQLETLASVPGHGPSDPQSRTVRASAESAAAGTHRSY
jgi:hypothetical protein